MLRETGVAVVARYWQGALHQREMLLGHRPAQFSWDMVAREHVPMHPKPNFCLSHCF
jgi:hypothetical protein